MGKKGWLLGTIDGSRRYYVSTNVSFDETKYPLKDHRPCQQALAQAWGSSPIRLKPTVIDLNTFLDMSSNAHDPDGPVQIVVDGEVVDVETEKEEEANLSTEPEGLLHDLPYGIYNVYCFRA
eukprot:660110-Rhodomonas_salina.1